MVIDTKKVASVIPIPTNLIRMIGNIKEVAMRRACCNPRKKHGVNGGISSTV
jgi:hypothetical protein